MYMRTALTLLIVMACTYGFGQPRHADAPARAWADSVVNCMTLDEKIGQLFMVAAYSNQGEAHENTIEAQIRKYHLGGIIFFQGDPARQVLLTNRFQRAAKYPLLIGLDAEHGAGWRLEGGMEFPKMGVVGAVGNDSLVLALGQAIARHCREIGVHVNFAPVVDVNSNPANPVIGIRSFGEDPETVAQKAILFMKGTQSEGVLPVAKHFPGHGDTDADSHKTLPVVSHRRNRLDSIELYPYRALIEAGVPAVMTSHLNVPALDSSGMPASLSPLVINGLLKEGLGFRGLCFTDAMNMKGVTQIVPPGEAEVRALMAGNDVLLFPENIGKAVEAIKRAVRDSLIDEGLLTEKCRRILVCKYRYALPNLYPSEEAGLWSRMNPPADIALKQRLYKEAITLVKNADSLLPLKRLDTLRIASLNFGGGSVNNFQTMLRHYAEVKHFTAGSKLSGEQLEQLCKKLEGYNCIIIYNQAGNNSAGKQFGYSPSLAALIRKLQGKRLILCQPALPYGLQRYAGLAVDALVVSYDKHLYAQQYAAQGIFGGIGMRGRLPESVDSVYRAGWGIRTQACRLGYEMPEAFGFSAAAFQPIDSLCRAAIKMEATPGCEVLVAYRGKVIYNKSFGFHTYNRRQKNTTEDIYDIASVTKIAATLPTVMKLYDERRIDLDTPLQRYYPPLAETDKADITVREVLCHNAGLKACLSPFYDAVDFEALEGRFFTTRPTAHNTLRLKPRLYANTHYAFKDSTLANSPKAGYVYAAPGVYLFPTYRDSLVAHILHSPLKEPKRYVYSDLGFILLQWMAENVTGEGIDRYCREHFFKPLGMNHTGYPVHDTLNARLIVPSSHDRLYRRKVIDGTVHDPTAAMLGGVAGHAGLFSTAEDLAKILQMYLNKGEYGGERYFSAETLDTFTHRSHPFPKNRRGLGFDMPEPDTTKGSPVCDSCSLDSYGHSGFTGILVWCDPAKELIYIFMSNRTYPNEYNTALTRESIRTKIQEVIYRILAGGQEEGEGGNGGSCQAARGVAPEANFQSFKRLAPDCGKNSEFRTILHTKLAHNSKKKDNFAEL